MRLISIFSIIFFAGLIAPTLCLDVYVDNQCGYGVQVAVTFFESDSSKCDWQMQCTNCVPACINYWYSVDPYSTSMLISGITNSCIYFTAYMDQDPSYTWPTAPNCPDACEHNLQYETCTGGADCYIWYRAISATQVSQLLT